MSAVYGCPYVLTTRCTSDVHSGFKPQSSTAKCTFALMEIVNYFQHNKYDVYVLLSDATKAFDKVNYGKRFNLLMDRGINSLLIRCLLYMNTNQPLERVVKQFHVRLFLHYQWSEAGWGVIR